MDDNQQKFMTIDDLAAMVAKGFENTSTKEDMTKLDERMEGVETRLGSIETRLDKLDHKMTALNSNVDNYLELSEKRYSELKQRDALLAGWIKLIAEKTNVPVDVSQLEKF